MYINLHVGIPAETWEERIVGMKEAREFHEGWNEDFLGSCGRACPVGSVALAWCTGFQEEHTICCIWQLRKLQIHSQLTSI